MDLTNSHVLVTGGTGFLGTHVEKALHDQGIYHVTPLGSRMWDLTRRDCIYDLLSSTQPDVVIHLAAVVGGIGANRKAPGEFFYKNAIMGIELLEACRKYSISKVVIAGTVCAYPKFTPVPFSEEDLWNGYPEETNAPYGLAKRMLLVQAQAYREQYGCNFVYLLPVNLYGPGDNFSLETGHVVPNLITKLVQAKREGIEKVTLWGDGTPTREFLHVRDAARGIVAAAQHYDGSEPVNLGSGHEISISSLACMIAEEVGYKGEFNWDTSKPNGQPRRVLDTSQAFINFGFRAEIPFSEGLRETIEWYKDVYQT